MNHRRLVALILAASASVPELRAQPAPSPAVASARDAASTSIRALALDLWRALAVENGNVAYSPTSVALALAMTTAGARGETQAELLRFLHFDTPAQLDTFGPLVGALTTKSKEVEFAIANRLFGDQSCVFEPAFVDALARTFGSPLESFDIRGEPERTRLHVNDWVAEHTGQKIRNILPPKSVDANTRLLLANAVYFLGEWVRPFAPRATSPQAFHLVDGTSVEVPTMSQTASLEFAEVDGSVVVQLGYRGMDFAMLFVLPPEDAKPASWLSEPLLSLPPKLGTERVHLLLPSFRLEAPDTTRLKNVMQTLGVRLAFEATRADLTGIANPPDPRDRLVIDEVYHKAFVRVDEKGTEAAAATVVAIARGTAAPTKPPREVRFDRPFWFVLRHLPSGAVLFVGKVMDPR